MAILPGPKFVAFDGEGYDINNQHEYIMLNSSTGANVENLLGLSTLECFDFILGHSGKGIGIAFAFSYDVNMMLKGLHPVIISKLCRDDWAVCHFKARPGIYYRIEYIPKKIFTLYECKRIGGKESVIRSFKIYDVFGFFQKSFISALQDFGIGTEYLAEIDKMKAARSDFASTDFNEIRAYCFTECKLLVELMEYVDQKFESVGIKLKHYHGAGAVASKVLQNQGLKNHIQRYEGPVKTAIATAYFGGRIQALEVGNISEIHTYDVVSAYPSAMLELPSISGVTPKKKLHFESGFSCWLVSWNVPGDIAPFPVRDKNGRIWYPKSGKGWYWSPEIEAALKIYGTDIKIHYGYTWKDSGARPFEFIRDLFELRKELKARGDDAQKCVKLALNSLYGKTAQGENNRGEIPPFQCYAYAGYITSRTRANLLELASQDFDSIVSFATDGIASKKPLEAHIGKDLGNWEYEFYDSIFLIKPGFYRLSKAGASTNRVRGFNPRNVDFDILQAVYDNYGISGRVPITETRFIGMKNRCEKYLWRNWYQITKELNFRPLGYDYLQIGNNYRILPPGKINDMSIEYIKKAAPEFMEIDAEDFKT